MVTLGEREPHKRRPGHKCGGSLRSSIASRMYSSQREQWDVLVSGAADGVDGAAARLQPLTVEQERHQIDKGSSPLTQCCGPSAAHASNCVLQYFFNLCNTRQLALHPVVVPTCLPTFVTTRQLFLNTIFVPNCVTIRPSCCSKVCDNSSARSEPNCHPNSSSRSGHVAASRRPATRTPLIHQHLNAATLCATHFVLNRRCSHAKSPHAPHPNCESTKRSRHRGPKIKKKSLLEQRLGMPGRVDLLKHSKLVSVPSENGCTEVRTAVHCFLRFSLVQHCCVKWICCCVARLENFSCAPQDTTCLFEMTLVPFCVSRVPTILVAR